MKKVLAKFRRKPISTSLTTNAAQEKQTGGKLVQNQQLEEVKTDLIAELGLTTDAKEATSDTIKVNSEIYSILDFEDIKEDQCAKEGLKELPEHLKDELELLELIDDKGDVIWSQKAYSFIEEAKSCPYTVNPSLWKNTKNNHIYGLFEVTEGIYQVRGYDMANLTLIKGETGWIVFDPLMSVECTQTAMQLVGESIGNYPIKAVIISHPHIDHFGGIKGVMTEEEAADSSLPIEEQIASGKIPIIVPYGFTEHAISENVYVGQAMGRRATYQYGVYLEPGEKGKMAMGIGMGQSTGSVSFIMPTYEVLQTGTTIAIDGITMEFQMTPDTEAPVEMNTWFPQKKALWVAENCTCTLHNLYTLRGAQVRDGAQWAHYICEAVTRYGKEVEVTFQSHNWPHWGNKAVNDYLVDTAAVYRYINDQTLTYINQGYTSDEISNKIKLPDSLQKNWYTRQYYGTVAHNSKAVYQKYMGWYDANPVNLNPLTPEQSAKKWIAYVELGSVDEMLRKAKEDFEAGEYQWVAQVTNTIVYADPENKAARLLCADALEQLGYQSESGTWRNAYLTGAKELRTGNATGTVKQAESGSDMQRNMTAEMIFDYMSILMDKEMMSDKDFTVDITLVSTEQIKQQYMLRFKNGAILQFKDNFDENASLFITTTKNALFYLLEGNMELLNAEAEIEGDIELLKTIMSSFNQFKPGVPASFNIVEP